MEKDMEKGIIRTEVNKICRIFEEAFDGLPSRRTLTKDFNYEFLKTDAKYNNRQFYDIKKLYDEFNAEARNYKIYANYERVDKGTRVANVNEMRRQFVKECSKICPDSKVLCNISLDMCYKREGTKRFAWEVSGDEIVNNLLRKNDNIITYPEMSDDGDLEYCGNTYATKSYKMEDYMDGDCYK